MKAGDTGHEEKCGFNWDLMLITVVWFQWCGIKSGFMVLGMCSFFFVRTSNDKLYFSDKSATIVADGTG